VSRTFDQESTRRISQVIRDAERSPRRMIDDVWLALRGGGGSVDVVLVKAPVGGIPSRNSGTGAHGTASCLAYTDDGSALTLSADSVTVHNWVLATVGAGQKDVLCIRTRRGYLLAINEVCG
jgi:hypothetical protein